MSHDKMGSIQLQTKDIPGTRYTRNINYFILTIFILDHMKQTVKLLVGNDLQAIQSHLPIHLESIQDIANEV